MTSAAWPHGDPNIVVHAVLAQPVFRAAAASSRAAPQRSLPEIAWMWFVDHVLRPLFPTLAHALSASHGVGTVVGVALIVASLAGLGFAIVRLALAFARPAAGAAATGAASGPLAALRTPAQWRARAAGFATQGDYARAIAALFGAALAALDARALVPFDGARTPGEYRRLVRRSRQEAAGAFDELCDRYVRAAYAAARPGAADFAAAERALAAFEPALGV